MNMDNIRPRTLDQIVGQEDIVEYLRLKIKHAKESRQPLSHTLLLGFAGSGKTTLSQVIANELGVEFHSVMASRISNFGELLSLVQNMGKNDVLFLDEIHALKSKIQEELYDLMEDFTCDIKLGTTIVKQKVEPFTLIGATTHAGELNPPLLSRFVYKPTLIPYTIPQLKGMIVKLCDRVYDIELPDFIVEKIAQLSKRTARTAYNLTRSVVEYVHASKVNNEFDFTPGKFNRLLQLEGLDPMIGLDAPCRRYLVALLRERNPLGVKPLSNLINENEDTITQIIEPFLMSDIELSYNTANGTININGAFIRLTKQGRLPTDNAKKYIDLCIQLQKYGWFANEKLNYF